MTYDRYEPKRDMNHAGLGAAIRRALTNEPKFIGPDTEGLAPGLHKQTDGRLLYVPDMAEIDKAPARLNPVYDEPEGDNPEDAGESEDLQCDAMRLSGFYETDFEPESVKYWNAVKRSWSNSRKETSWNSIDEMLQACLRDTGGMIPNTVLRARPDLDARVQK